MHVEDPGKLERRRDWTRMQGEAADWRRSQGDETTQTSKGSEYILDDRWLYILAAARMVGE